MLVKISAFNSIIRARLVILTILAEKFNFNILARGSIVRQTVIKSFKFTSEIDFCHR